MVKRSCSKSNREGITLEMTFDVLNVVQDAQNTPFTVQLQIVVKDKVVYLHLPALNFTLPFGGGYLATIEGFLPKKLTPVDPLYQSFTLQSDQTNLPTGSYDGYIANDGSLRIVGSGDQPIPAGPQVSHAKTITYMLPFKRPCAPKNFPISLGFSRMNQPDSPNVLGGFGQFLDWYRISFVNGVAVFCYADNTLTKDVYPYSLNTVTRVGKMKKDKDGHTKLKLKKPVLAFEAPFKVYAAENSVTIDPTNPMNMFFTTQLSDYNLPFSSPVYLKIIGGVSSDGGKSWVTRRLDNSPPFPTTGGDTQALFDKFGNLWMISLIGIPARPTFAVNYLVALSTDKGQTFQTVYQSTDGTTSVNYDYPQLAFGGDGNGGWAVWWTIDYIDVANYTFFNPQLGYVPISPTGVPNPAGVRIVDLPAIGAYNSLGLGISLPSLTVTDDGIVYFWGGIVSTTPIPSADRFDTEILYVNPKGINFTADEIIGPLPVSKTNIDEFTGDPTTNSGWTGFPWQNVRGISLPGSRTLVYDNSRGLLYALVADLAPWNSTNGIAYLIYSSNGGQSWSEPIPITDDNIASRGLFGMDLDPSTGNIAFNWYDTRGDPSQNSVRFFGSVLLGSEIDDIRGSKEKCSRPNFSMTRKPEVKKVELTAERKEQLKKRVQRRFRA